MPQPSRKRRKNRDRGSERGEGPRCRHCGCTEQTPCTIYTVTVRFDGQARMTERMCAWYKANVCSAPPCVEKGYRHA